MIINEKTWRFIRAHADDDVQKLALKGSKDADINQALALQQIAGRQTARRKLPSWAQVEGIVYPPHLNMEQCSSEQTARYKAAIINRLLTEGHLSDNTFVDLTGGFGIDFFWMSQNFQKRYYVEQNEQLCAISSENFKLLEHDCSVSCCDAATYLAEMSHTSVAYLDPARRDGHGTRTYGIEDCTPNVLDLLPLLTEKSDSVILKLSPMLDWRKAVDDINRVSVIPHIVREVHIVSIANECKELLLVLSKVSQEGLRLFCINDDQRFVFIPREGIIFSQAGNKVFPRREFAGNTDLTEAALYLYEPNASIMKAGCFSEMEAQYAVTQIATSSHLFLSSDEIGDFPGRHFRIMAISSMNKQTLKLVLADVSQANITVRNFPLSAEQLRKKLKLKDGGQVYIFATTLTSGEHKLFICRKIG